METMLRPIAGKVAWYGRDLQDQDGWIRTLTDVERGEIADALAAVKRAGLPFHAIRRADFFEILRKEHEIAVKMLWQFLGVLADRLDQTSSELHNAKRELAAEDVTSEIFPEIEVDVNPPTPPSLSGS